MREGWEMKKLGEVCTLQRGFDLPTHSRIRGNFPLVSSNGITDKINNWKIKAPGVVTGRSGSIGNVHYIHDDYWPLNTALYVKDFHGNDPRFIFYLLTQFDLIRFSSGAGVPTLNRNHVHDEKIFISTNGSEQKRIVAILDEAFAAIAKAKANVERNLQNAKDFFECYLQGVFESKGEDWEKKELRDVCNVVGGGTPSKSASDFYNGNILWATVRDMKIDIIINTEHKITQEAIKNSSTNIVPKNNIVIATRVGLGKVCIVKYDTAINQDLKGIIPKNDSKLSVDFLFRWFKSITQLIIDEGTGATVQGVKLTFINSLKIPLPSIKEQAIIVNRFDALEIEAKRLQTLYTKKLQSLNELKKSLLQKAFSGELTANPKIPVP